MLHPQLSTRSHKTFEYLVCYTLFAALVLLAAVEVFVIWRLAILAAIAAFIGPSAVNSAIYMFSMVVLGLGAFVLLMAAEPYLRHGMIRGQLWQRFTRFAAPLVIAGLVGLLLEMWLITMIARP